MKRFGILFLVLILGLVLACGSGEVKNAASNPATLIKKAEKVAVAASAAAPATPDPSKEKSAAKGYFVSIEKKTLDNKYYRQVLFSGKHLQLVVMSLQPGEEIGKEMHANLDQFFRIEGGKGKFIFGGTEEYVVGDGDAVVVPAGIYHNVVNTSSTKPLKLYTIYAPPLHPEATVHKTKAEAAAAEHH